LGSRDWGAFEKWHCGMEEQINKGSWYNYSTDVLIHKRISVNGEFFKVRQKGGKISRWGRGFAEQSQPISNLKLCGGAKKAI